MPPNSLLRPLPVDIIGFLTPLLIGVLAFCVGRFFHRWSVIVRAMLVGVIVGCIFLAWGLLVSAIPRPIDVAFSYVGGVTIVLCWLILGIIGFNWASPDPSSDVFVRFFVAVIPLALIGIEAGGSLWFRFEATDPWLNRPTPLSGMMAQSTKMTCLPVSAAMLLHHYGIDDTSEGELAYLANTSLFGTDNNIMARAITRKIGKRGVRAIYLKTTYDDMVERGTPFIAQVQLERFHNHAVLVTSITPHTVSWIDPADGIEVPISPDVFNQTWTGGAIIIQGMDPKPVAMAEK